MRTTYYLPDGSILVVFDRICNTCDVGHNHDVRFLHPCVDRSKEYHYTIWYGPFHIYFRVHVYDILIVEDSTTTVNVEYQ